MPFRYKKVLILGATSGIGEALAKKFLQEGSSVIAVGRRKENLDRLQSEVGKDGKLDTAAFDITNFDAIPQFAKDITSKHPDLDCVFLNAGMQRHVNWRKPESVDMDLINTEFKTNYLSYLHFTKAFLPFLQKQAPKEVSIVYVTSGLALSPIIYCPNYCASKAALHHHIMMLRLQMKDIDSNVKIIELLPPAVQTELHDDKHQPEFKGTGRDLGMRLDDFVEEAYTGLNQEDNEQIPVEKVKPNFTTWEQDRQKAMMAMYEQVKHMVAMRD